jgi:hypothetical protein
MKGAQILCRIWIREGMDDDKTDSVLRHEIAHARVPRHRLCNPLRDKVIWGLGLIFLFGGFAVLITGSRIIGDSISIPAFLGMIVRGFYGYARLVNSKQHETMAEDMAKNVSYTIHDHRASKGKDARTNPQPSTLRSVSRTNGHEKDSRPKGLAGLSCSLSPLA